MQTVDKFKIEKKHTILIGACCILPVIIMFIYGNFFAPTNKEEFIKSELRGFVVDKYIDQKNHRTRTVRIKENQKDIINEFIAADDTLFYNYVNSGDSIIKIANLDFLVVQRQDSLRKFKIYKDE